MTASEVGQDHRSPLVRLSRLLDKGFTPITDSDESTVMAARGCINGDPVVTYCTDGSRMGGSLGLDDARRIVAAIDTARHEGLPVVGLWHSGGAKLAEGVRSMHGVGQVFAAMTRASGVIPQVSVILGPAAGAAAYGPALTDVVIMAPQGKLFITGPQVVQSVTGEKIDMEGLGGAEAHSKRSGVAHVVTTSEEEAMRRARRITGLLARRGRIDVEHVTAGRDLMALLPESRRRAYDVRPIVAELLDAQEYDELSPRWARNISTGLGRIGGGTVGVVANNPLYRGGCLDSLSAEKAARFVRMCNAFGIPLLVLVDVPGYLPGVREEWGGVVRRGAKLLHAFAEAVVPRVTVVLRKAYGGAYIAMNSRSLGATAVYAWPGSEVAVMGAPAAVDVLYRRRLAAAVTGSERDALRLELIDEHSRTAGGIDRGLELGVVDAVIEPCETRPRVAAALASSNGVRGNHGNIPL
jgi:acetyl-CoA/propionyl-CoA carboxylase carboxyl transferase subunit